MAAFRNFQKLMHPAMLTPAVLHAAVLQASRRCQVEDAGDGRGARGSSPRAMAVGAARRGSVHWQLAAWLHAVRWLMLPRPEVHRCCAGSAPHAAVHRKRAGVPAGCLPTCINCILVRFVAGGGCQPHGVDAVRPGVPRGAHQPARVQEDAQQGGRGEVQRREQRAAAGSCDA